MSKKIPEFGDKTSPSLLKQKIFGGLEASRMPKDPGNRKRLAAAFVMKAKQQKTLRTEDISVERRTPVFSGIFGGSNIIFADNDPTDHGVLINADPTDRIVFVDGDPTDGSGGVDADLDDLPVFR